MDATTFLAAIGLLALIRIVEQPPARARRRHWARELAAGLTYTARTTALRQTTIAYAIAFVVFGVCVPLVLQVISAGLHHPASWRGVLTTAEGVGGAFGGIVSRPGLRGGLVIED